MTAKLGMRKLNGKLNRYSTPHAYIADLGSDILGKRYSYRWFSRSSLFRVEPVTMVDTQQSSRNSLRVMSLLQ